MNNSIENRLKRMRKLVRFRDKNNSRRISLNDWRKEKRQKLVNEYRKIDFDWIESELEEDIDCVQNISDYSKCVEILFEYLSGQTLLTESMARKCFEVSKTYLIDNEVNGKDLIQHKFFKILCDFVGKPLIPSRIKSMALDLIQQILFKINVEDFADVIIESGLILSAMINLNAFDIEVLTKTVALIQELTRSCCQLLWIALNNGYLLFLTKIVKTTQVFCQRKSTETMKSKQISEKKLNLVRHISETLRSAANHLYKSDIIRDLYPLFEKLIHFKDKKIVCNALWSLTVIIEQNPESINLLNRYLIISMTDLMSQNNENISSIVVHFWKLFNERIGDNVVHSFKSLLIESNLIKKLNEIFFKVESNRLVTEAANLLTEFIDRFDNSFELMIDFDIYRSLLKALSFSDYLSRREVLNTIIRIVDRIESYQVLNHLLEIEIIESLSALLHTGDPNLMPLSSQTLAKILQKSHQFGLKDIVLIRAEYCSLDLNSFLNQNIL